MSEPTIEEQIEVLGKAALTPAPTPSRPQTRSLTFPAGELTALITEVVDLNAEPDELAKHLRNITTLRNALSSVSRTIQDEILYRQTRDASYTTPAGPLKLVGDSPDRDLWEYDADGLREDLERLVADGRFSLVALDKAVKPTHRVDKRGLKALRGLGEDVAEVIDRHRKTQRPRSVRVEERAA